MNNLSLVFQGPASEPDGSLCAAVLHNLQRTRQAFPASEIILSSWEVASQQVLLWSKDLDPLRIRLVLSVDPGRVTGTDKSVHYETNINRLLVSSRAGLAAVSKPLAVKLRTDTWLSGRSLISMIEQYVISDAHEIAPRNPAYRVFRSRVINAHWFARDARGSLPYLFHPGDIFLAGYTEDLRLFFSAPLAGAELFLPTEISGIGCPWRYVPEQWLWLHAIHKVKGKWAYTGNFDHCEKNITASEQFYLANFIPYSSKALDFHWSKYWRCYPFRGLFSVYTHSRWLRLAARYQGHNTVNAQTLLSELLTKIWLYGYRLRTRLLRNSVLRRIAMNLFVHRQ